MATFPQEFTDGTTSYANLKGGFRLTIRNTVAEQIATNSHVIRIEALAYRTSTAIQTYNTNSQTSYYKLDGGSQYNYSSSFDFRNATVNTKYYIDGSTSVFPTGAYKDYTIVHDADGTKTVNFTAYINMGGTGANGMTLTKTVELPDIDRGLMRVNIGGGVWKSGIPYVNIGSGVWKAGIAYINTGSGWEIGI